MEDINNEKVLNQYKKRGKLHINFIGHQHKVNESLTQVIYFYLMVF